MLNEILSLLDTLGQPHLAAGLETLSLAEQEAFFAELKNSPPHLLQQQATPENLEPVKEFDVPDDALRLKGHELLSQGKVACLVLAGGQGTRLSSALPKALTPVTPVRQKTLLQLLCEKTAAASSVYKVPLQIAIMTSLQNNGIIAGYLKENGYFGLRSDQVHLFNQDNAPFLDDQGKWILEAPGKLASGPDGNGHALQKLMQSGIGAEWKNQGIEAVMVLPIDNPLADPFDAALCGSLMDKDVVIKAILRKDPQEKVGVIVRREGSIGVQEYSELPAHFEAPLAHIGLFCFRLSFIERVANAQLPWHFARKKEIWKCERFLFDVLSYTDRCGILVYPREDVYAPLKNLEGRNSLATVRHALADFDRRLLSALTKAPVPAEIFELDPAFHYLTADQKAEWERKTIPSPGYVMLRYES